MDIIDIMLARAMTPQGKTDSYVAKANLAAQKAVAAEESAEAAVAALEAAATDIANTKDAADTLLETAQEALETIQEAQANVEIDVEDIDDEVKKLTFDIDTIDGTSAKTVQFRATYPDNTPATENIIKMYKATGSNEDGTMTQKAITDALSSKADSSSLSSYASITYVDNAINNIPSSGSGSSSTNLGSENAGNIVIVGPDGTIISGDTTENNIIEALLRSGIYQAKDALGLDINYQEKSYARTQEAAVYTMGSDFNQYPMYGGRVRCNVADDGTINAFYGESAYRDDGSNGQVMVYQPKFYYQRIPLKVESLSKGQLVRRESIIISAVKQSGLKLHPLFNAGNGEELEYVLLPAYEGSINSNKLSSIAGVQPASGMTIAAAETYATARGNGWHIMNMAAISANQMLEIIEFGTMNGQAALEKGISNLSFTSNVNCAALTGSTASLGNSTGHATTTTSNNNGTLIENTTNGKRAISYRGMENPWGNMWNMIGGFNLKGDGNSGGGAPYICTNFNYTPSTIGNNYEYIGFNLPSVYGWINAMGYGNTDYDWVLLPAECSSVANSELPVGDNLWTIANTTTNKVVAIGGTYGFQENNGPFYYACDSDASDTAKHNYSARLMFIPTRNTTYNSNITKWRTHIGG